MNTESIPARNTGYGAMSGPGDFCFDPERRHLYIILPGRLHPDCLRITRGAGGKREWTWDGNEEKPTLTPSISDPGHWHGYLKAGRLESC